jgi:hypothetical protein
LKKSLLKELIESLETLKSDLKVLKALNQLERNSNEDSIDENNLNDLDHEIVPSPISSSAETASFRNAPNGSNEFNDQDIEKRENGEAKTRSPYLRFGRNKVFLRFGKRSAGETVSNKKRSNILGSGK